MSTLLSMRTYIFLIIGALFIFITGFTIFFVHSNMRDQAISEAQSKARLLLDCNLATHTYFTRILKPSLFETIKPISNKDYFDPAWMSSTYAVGKMHEYFRHFSPETFMYKEASIDARSDQNEADDLEKTFLKELKADPSLVQKNSIRFVDGKPYLTIMRRGEEMQPSCLRCHSTPDQAPGDLVARYGPVKSFNRNLDDVAQAISVRIPLSAAYRNSDYFSVKLSAFLVAALMACFFGLFVFLKFFMVSPLDSIRRKAVMIADNPESIGEQIEAPKTAELKEFVEAFNKMSSNLKKSHESLEEKVRVRTQELLQSRELLHHEIAERKKIEASLRNSETTLRTLLDTAPVGVGLIIDRKFGWTNKTLSQMTGYSAEELYGHSSRMIYPDESEFDRVGDVKYEAIHRTGCGQIQTRFMTKDGELLDILLRSSAIDRTSLSEGVVFTAMDITELQAAQSALKESESKYRLLTENMNDVIWSLTSSLEYSYVSPSIKNQLGYDPEEVIGKRFLDFISPVFYDEVLGRLEERIQHFYQNGDSSGLVLEIEQLRKDGKFAWNELVANPVIDGDGVLQGFQGVSRDITDRRKAEKEKIELERQLLHSQKLESLGLLSGGIAHDFNNLLTVVIGNLEMALYDAPSGSDLRMSVENSIKAARKCGELSRQMLAYSGKGLFQITNVNMKELVEQNAQIFRTAIPKTISLVMDLDDHTPSVKADAGQIQQIIMNLITNASEALTGKNGTIRVATGARYCDSELLSKSIFPKKPEPQDMVFIQVTDDGCGMDSTTIDRIFDPFFTTKFTGRGLGMSVIHGIVRGHDGAIIVDSNLGSGTTITIYLPVSDDILESDESLKTPTTSKMMEKVCLQKESNSILVVDDEVEVNQLMIRILNKHGVNAIPAYNGKQALEIFEQTPESFCLVIVDLTMPEMDGVETFKRLKQIRPDINFILCSGYDEFEISPRFDKDLRPQVFLKKPFDYNTVRDLIQNYM